MWKNIRDALANTLNGFWQISYIAAIRTGRFARSKGYVFRVRDSAVQVKNKSAYVRQELQEIDELGGVEGRFMSGKRKLGLFWILAKMKETAGSMITMDFLNLIMKRLFRRNMMFLYAFLLPLKMRLIYCLIWAKICLNRCGFYKILSVQYTQIMKAYCAFIFNML